MFYFVDFGAFVSRMFNTKNRYESEMNNASFFFI